MNMMIFFIFRVDFIIPNIETVGGYSMCSSPIYLQKNRMLELAVKNSLHPPANWIHNEVVIVINFL